MFNDHYEVPSSIYFCPCLNLVLSAFISVLRLKFLIAYLTSLQTFFYAYRASKQFILSFQNLQPFPPIFLIPSPLQKNNGLSGLIDDEPVNLTDSVSIWGSPTQSVCGCLCRGTTETYHPFPAVFETKFNKPFSIVVDGSATLLTHCIFSLRRCCHLKF